MKTLIVTAIALSVTAPAFAESAAEMFALSNDSAAERIVHQTSIGDVDGAKVLFAMKNESPAEGNVYLGADTVTRDDVLATKSFFSMFQDSAAEIK